MKKRMLKLRTKMLFPYIIVILPIIIAVSVLLIFLVRGTMIDQLELKIKNITKSTAEISNNSLLVGDFKKLDQILNNLVNSDDDIVSAVITNENGLSVSSTEEDLRNKMLNETEYDKMLINELESYHKRYIDNNHYQSAYPIYTKSIYYDENDEISEILNKVGVLRLNVSLDTINNTIMRIILLISAILFFAILYGILLFVISQSIFKSINITLKGFDAISKGNLHEKIDINTRDEIELLADGFNTMADKLSHSFEEIERQNEEIKQYNTHLEEMVAERTKELNEKNEQLLEDLRMAQKVQHGMIPNKDTLPDIKEIKFGTKYIALESIGGDLYDVIKLDEGKYGLLIADVSGHGVPAALVSSMAKVSFSTNARNYDTTGKICHRVNNEIYHLIGHLEYDLTAFFSIIDIKEQTIQFTNAGHHPALLYRASENKIYELEALSGFIGLMENIEFDEREAQIKHGDKILYFTDGIIEAANEQEELYDVKRFKNYILKHGHKEAYAFVEGLIKEVQEFCGTKAPDDDIALLCIDFHLK